MQVNDRGRRRRTLDARVVKQEARGRWLNILDSLAPGLRPAIARPGRHVPCPVHGGKDGFRLFKNADETGGGICNTCGSFDDGMALLMWYNEWDFPQTVEAVGQDLGLNPEDQDLRDPRKNPPPAMRPVVETEAERRKREYKDAKCREELKRVWTEAVHISAPEAEPVRLYLARRGLRLTYALSSPVLKFHPRMGYFHEGEVIGEYPCMLALAFDADDRPVTIHRTFLTEEGFKAPVPKAKKLMPYPSDRKLSGGYIPLVDLKAFTGNLVDKTTGVVTTALGVTEGIETALAVIEASKGKMPVWPLVSDRLLEGFHTPEVVDELCIYGDQDLNNAGLEAAAKLKERAIADGKKAYGWLPPVDVIPEGAKGIDWLDVLIMEGPEAIPFPAGLGVHDEEEAYG